MKNIVIIQNTTLSENYGLSTYLRNIITELSKNNNLKINIICAKGMKNKESSPSNVNLIEVNTTTYSTKDNLIFIKEAYKNLKIMHKDRPINTIHCLYPNSSVIASILFKLTTKQRPTIIYDLRSPWIHIAIERGSIPKFFALPFKFIAYSSEFAVSLFVDRFIFITKGLRHHYEKYLYTKNKPMRIIPSGIDTKLFKINHDTSIRKQHGISNKETLIGYVGVVSSLRHLSDVINALSKLPTKYKLMIVGDGDDLENLKILAKSLSIENRVFFIGRIPHYDINKYMNNFDFGICHLPDTFVFRQSYPMKVLEYLASGDLVLASEINAHKEISSQFPRVLTYKDEGQLVKLISKSRISKLIPDGIRKYDWSRIASSIEKTY
jgi:glycosyltransferase involved in cell wall biosynthesis